MPYLMRTVKAGQTVEIRKYYAARLGVGGTRSANRNATPEDVLQLNEKHAEERLRWLINSNFEGGDLNITLTYDSSVPAPAPQDAKRELERFLRGARKIYQEAGKVFKYIAVTEYKAKRIHHHLLLKRIDAAALWALWEERMGHGAMRTRYLDSSGQYSALAAYMIKETRRSFRDPDAPYKRRWNSSRNLEKPQIKRERVNRDSWRQMPKARRGYRIEAGSLESGVDAVSGAPWQEYRMIALPAKNENRRM